MLAVNGFLVRSGKGLIIHVRKNLISPQRRLQTPSIRSPWDEVLWCTKPIHFPSQNTFSAFFLPGPLFFMPLFHRRKSLRSCFDPCPHCCSCIPWNRLRVSMAVFRIDSSTGGLSFLLTTLTERYGRTGLLTKALHVFLILQSRFGMCETVVAAVKFRSWVRGRL